MLRLLFRLWMGARLPLVQGELALTGLDGDIIIRRDGHGVPHIEAGNDADAAFALGFVQAQDRAGQLETYLRIIRGTLSELVGVPGLPVDKLSRRIGFSRAARQQVKVVDEDVRISLERFAAGVNAGMQHGSKHWPHDFALLKTTPTAWEAADVLAYIKFISFQLPSNWDVELARYLMLRQDGRKSIESLDPASNITRLIDELNALEPFVTRGGGSNNWLVDSNRTTSGKPLMGSDPHLGPSLPNPWYLAHVITPAWSVAGAMFAGSPVFPIAHNGFACWSVTAGLTDTTDLFLETLSEDGKRCLQPDGSWIDCELITEKIAIGNSLKFVEERVLVTPRGPIVTPLIPNEKQAISLAAVWLAPRKMRGFFDAPRARSFEQFRQSFEAWPVLPLNVLYADESGAVGSQLVGELPVRAAGYGLMPTPVSRGAWTGFLPFAQMPYSTSPVEGVFATANDDPLARPETAPSNVILGDDFVDPYRARVIREELLLRKDWSVQLFQQLQLNLRSMPWEEIRETILKLEPSTPEATIALDELRAWDGYVTADSSGAAVFELFAAEMAVRVAQSNAKECWRLALGGSGHGPFASSLLADRRVGHLVKLILIQPDGWFASWNDELLSALSRAVVRLREEAGPSPPYWAWGHRRMLRLRHALFGKHWLLGRVFNLGPIPMGGDMNTIQQAGVRPMTPFTETHNFPNLRCVFDVSNWANCRFALAGGQSGNPCSPHFGDQFPLWQKGEGIPIAWNREDVLRATTASLRLTPQ